MNKIYKVVWSKVRNAYIVVSELAKRNSKTKSQHTSRVPHSLLRLAVVTSLSLGIASTLTFPAFATNAWGTISGTTNVAAGGGSNASGTNSVAVGNGSTASGTNAAAIAGGTAANDYSLAFGLGSIAGTAGATNNKAVAIGYNAIAYSLNDVVIGANQTAITANYGPSEDTPNGSNTSSAFGGRVLIGHDNIAYGRAGNSVILGSNNRSNAVHGIAIGQNVVVGQPDGGTLAYENAMGFGTNTRSYSTNTIAIGNNAIAGNTDTSRTSYDANGDSAVAIGAASQSTSGFTVAIGGASSATAIEAVAIGKNSNASAIYAVATGSGAQATNQGNIAVGASANASGENAMAVGRNATTAGVRASAFGYNAVASGGGAMAQGTNANASGSYSMSIGYDTVASAGSAISFGYLAKSLGTRSISIGREASAGTASTDPDAIAIGYQTVAPAGNSIAIGKTAAIDSSAASAIALGSAATAKIATSVAIGSGSTTERSTDTTSQGWNVQDSTWSSWLSTKGNAGTTSGGVWNSSAGVVSIGTDGFAGNSVTRKLTGLAAGQYDTDAVNMKQWTNTMLATTGDFQASGSTQYGSDNTPRTATKLLNESLKITGGVDNTLYYQSDFSTSPNIGSVISDNKVTLLLNKTLRGLETIYLTNPTTGNATTLSGNGITIRPSGGTAVSLTGTGLNNGGNKITNVAAGTAGTDGVNVSQLNQAIAGVSGGSGSTTTVTVEGGTAAGTDSTYTGNNLQITSTTGTNSIAYDLKLADKVTLGSTGTTGTDGSLTVNGTGGSSVAVDGATGSVALTGTDGSTATIAAGTATSDVNGTSINRITAGGATVATLDDGMVYTGDTGTAAVKLNKTVNIVGGETDSTKLSTDNNIGIVAAQDGDNGKLTVRLAKDITGLNTVTAGDAILGNQTATTAGGTSQEGSYVTGLDNTTWNVANPDIVSGRAATEDQLKTVSDAIIDGTSENATGGFGLTDDNNTAVKQDLGKTIQIAGDGNITTTADADGKKITVGLKNTVALGESGSESGSLTVNGAAGSSVAVDGATGSVALAGTDGSTATIAAGTSAPNLAGTSINRITVGGATVATLDDGMKYYGDFGSVASVKLNNQVNVKGEATTEANLTTGNIGVVSSQDGNNALLTVKLNKDLNLGSTGSLTMGNTVVNNSGITITPATGDPVSLTSSGLDNGNNKIINVAPGEISETSTDAINGSQLWKELQNISGGSGTTTSITVEGGTAAGTGGTYAGSNLQVTSTTATDGSKTYDMKLADNITLGSTGTDGVDGSVTVNGKDGSSVAVDGSTGSVTLTGNDGSTATIAAGTSAPNLAGTSINRITAGGATVATLDDGMKYGGDFGTTSSVKLNNQVNVKGEATSEADLTTGNIGVVSSQDGDNGLLTVKLNKDINLGDTGSVTTGNTVVNNDGVKVGDTALATGGLTITNGPSVTTTGIDAGSKQITNVASGSDGTDADNNPTYNTLTNGANIGDIKNITDAAKTELTNDGLNFTADSGDAVHRNLGETLNIAGDGNITTTSDATNGKITVGLSNTVSVGTTGTDGVNGTVTVNGTDGSSVAINGADGTIALNKADGSPVTIAAGTQVNNLAGTPIDRITVGGATVATMDDGMKYGGDFGTVSNVKLNNQVNVKGEATTEANLTTGNIGVVSNQDGDNGLLTVKLNKDIDLGSTGSLTTGNTVVNNDGIKITPTTGDPVSLTSSGLDNGNQKIINVAAGTADTDAVNVGQLTKAIQGVSSGEGSKTNLTVEGGTAAGTGGNYTGSNLQLTEKTETTGATTYDVKLADNITLGSAADTEAGTTGTDSSITVNGADGSAVAINGADGSIALNTADGSPVTIKAGTAADDVNGNSINRVTVGGATVATLDDGMVYTGDTGTAAVKLNKTVNIVGGETDSSKLSTDNNIGIVAEQDGDNGKLTVRLAKDITGLNTVTAGDATLGNQSTTTAGGVAQTGSYVTGLDNTTWNVSNPDIVSGRAATEDQLKTVSDALADGTSENATGGFGLADESGTTVKQDLGKTITVKGGVTDGTTTTENPTGTSNITTAVKDGALEVSLNKDIDLGSTGSVTTGNTVINNDGVTVGDTKLATDGLTITNGPSVTTEGINAGGKQITNVASGSDGVDASGNPTYNNLTNGANIGDIKNITDAAKTELTNDGLNFTADSGDTVHRNLGETLNIAGDGNITTTSDATNGKITVGLSNTVAVGTTGTDGENGTVTVNGTDGSSVAINGSDGSIVMNNGSGSPVTIAAGSQVNNLAGTPIDRITVGGSTVATLDDGMKYYGDFGTLATVKLNNQVNVKGEATTAADLTTGNIGVVSSQDGDNALLTVKLNKDINLGSTGSLTTGNTVVNNDGITITPSTGDPVSLTGSGLDNGNNVISNVATGVKGTDAVNVDQLTKAIQDVNAGEGSKTNLTVEGGTAAGTDGNYTGTNLQVTEKTETNGSTTYDVKLADNLTLGSANGSDGTGGVDGSITLTGADGSTATIAAGPAANDVNGKSIDRITVGGATVATLDDGMVYTGDTGSAAVKLNKTVNIVGGETDATKLSTDNNIGIVAAQDGDNGKLTVRLAKDITGLNTVEAGDAVIGNQGVVTAGGVAQDGSYVTGLDNTTWNVSDPDIVTGRAATEDQLKTVSDAVVAVADGTSENATGGFGLADGSGTTVKQDLGKTITVKGGVTDGTATTENPTGTSNITTAVKDGALEVSLNKDIDLGSTGSVTTGNTVVNNDGVKVGDTTLTTGGLTITNGPSVTTDGINAGGKQITNVASGSDGVDASGNPTYNNLTNGANIGDIKNITDAAKTELTNDGLNFTADSGDTVHRNLGETLNIAGDGNITTTSDATNGKITVGLSNTVAVGTTGTDGENGTVTVNGTDGSSVAINGSNGSIVMNTGSGSPVTIQAGSSVNDVTGSPINRITVGGATVATLDDGMKYGGDFGTVSNVKLNNQVDVKGEATTEADLTTGNIGVVSSQAGDNGLLVVKLNKDLNLGSTGSVTMGNTVVNNSGVTIGSGDTAVSLTDGGLNNGGNKITNVAAGTDGTDAVNVTQLEQRIAQIAIGESKTTEITVDGGTAAPTDGTYAGSNLQVNASTTANGSPTYDIKLADNITLGSAADSTTGTTGTDSSITLNGADGSSVVVNGADGSVTTKGTDGSAVAINGSNGSIVLNTGSGSPVTIQAGTSANNLAGTSVDRISVGGQTVATLSDGLKYAGDDGQTDTTKVIAKELNEQLDIVGGADATKLTDNNIGVNNVNGQLKVQLVKDIDLGDTGSVTVGTAVLGNQTVTTASGVSQTGTYLTGLSNTAWDTANPDAVSGRAATEDQLKAINDKVNAISTGTGAFGLTDDNGAAVKDSLGETIQLAGDGNITTTADADSNKLTIGLSNDISVGKSGTDGTDGKIGVNGKDGSSVVINGADGTIGLTGPAGADGTPGATITIAPGTQVNNLAGTPIDRVTVGGATVTTLDDGMKYGGDFGTVSKVKLNNQVNVKGEATTEGDLTTGNIGVVSSQEGANGLLTVKLNKDLKLGDTGSVTTGATVINNDGVTITPTTGNPVKLTGTGLDNGGNTITNVGAGTANTDAVNYGQLKAAATAVTVEGGTPAGTSDNYAGKNLQLAATTAGDKTTYDLKLADKITLGSAADSTAGTAGTDSSITVNGADGSSVAIDGSNGSITLNTADGSPVTIKAGSANDVTGTAADRITIGDQTVATLNDGMVYTGDTGSAAVKLNKTVNIVGGETDSTKLSTGNNIGIVAEQDSDNAKLTVRLAKDITGLNTVEAGDAVIGNQSVLTGDGYTESGSYVTGLENTTWDMTNPDIVSGRAATEDQLKSVSDAIIDGTGKDAIGGFGLTDDSGTAVKQDLGKTIQIAGDGNITTIADADGKKLTVGLSNDLSIGTAGTDGEDGKVAVNGKDGSGVALNGADGSIGLTGPAGADGTPGTTVTIKVADPVNDVTGTPIDRITVGGATVATLDDGMKYGGDFGSVSNVKLNNQVNVKGNAANEADLTDFNIGVVSSQTGDNGLLTVKLNKDINLGSTGSVTTGATVVNNDGVTITPSTGNPVTLTGTGLNNGGNKITNVASGTTGTTYDTSVDGQEDYNNAANIGDLTTAINDVKNAENGGGFGLTDDSGAAVKQDLGKTIQVAGDGQNITTTADATNGKITVALSNDISIGAKDGADGTDGVDGKIGVNGKDGSAVVINGADGSIGLTGPAGADGTPGTTVTIKAGDSVNNVEGTPVDRITAGGETIATMSDGQKYAGDNGQTDTTKVIAKKLNEQLDIIGGADADKLTENNIGVNNVNGQLKVQLVKDIDLGDTGSVTTGATVMNNDGITITPAAGTGTGNPVTLTGTGLNNGGNQITNVASGTTGTTYDTSVEGQEDYNNAANIGDLTTAINDVKNAENGGGFGLTDDSGAAVKQDLGKTIQVAGDGQNITTTADATNGKITVALSNDISIGAKDGADGTDGVDGKIGVNGKDGSAVVINGADGSIGLTGPAGADGTPGTTVTIKAGDSVNNVEGNPVDRITAGGETIASMSDGQKYAGDNGQTDTTKVIAKKLNEQLDIVGGADADKLTENNIGVNNVDGKLKVQLVKDVDLGDTGSVTTGATVMNNDGITITPAAGTGTGNPVTLTGTGLNNGGNQITNVASGADGVDADGNPTYNTDTNAANIGDLNNVSDALVNKGMDFTADSGDTVHRDLGEALGIVGDGQNITTTTDATNGKITVALSNDISIGAKDGADGTDGVDGKIGVNGKDGSAVVINGADGSIGLTGPAGADGTPGTTVTIKAGDSVNNVEGNPVDRITAGGETIATMSDGQKYAGDNAKADGTNVIAKKLNEQLDIIGGADADKLTENNIGVNNVNGQLKVQLVKDIDLGTEGSVTMGNTVVNNSGMTIGSGDTAVSLTNGGLNNGGNQITNVASGSDGVDADGNPTYNTDTNAANIGDLNNVSDALVNKGMDFTADSGDTVHRDLGEALGIVGDGQNITTTTDPTNGNITVALSDNLSIGAKDGTNGSIGVNGSDGNVVTIDGNDGISIKGADGKDGVSITGKDGVDGVDGLEGHIGLNGKDGVTDIYTTPGEAGVNGKDGETMTRIIYTDPKGTNHQVATLDDGMKYYGDFGDVASVKLNKQVNVKGEATSEDDLTTGNIGVVSSQDGDNALLTVKLNKDINLGSNGSVTMGNTVINNSGMTITPSNGTPVSLTDAGLNNGGNKIINVAPGAINDDSTDAVNGSQLNEIRKLAGQHTYVTVEGGTEGGASEYQGKNLLLQTKRDNNLTTYYDLKLSDNITLGSANNDEGTDGVDSSITLNGADGSSVAINGADGSIALTSGANGSTATIAAGTSAPNLAGTDIDRITVGGSTVATLDDGMKYGGDFGDASKVKLNNQVNVKGNAKNEADLTDGNIGVVSSQEDENGLLTVKLNKDINLGETGSVTMGNTVVNNSGVTIGSGTSAVTLTDKGLNNGGNQITNVASGTTGNTYDTSVAGQENYNNAANIGDLTNAVNNAVENITDATKGGGFALSADDNNSVKQNLGDTIAIAGDGNTVTSVKDGKLVVGLNKDVDLGTDGSLTAGNTTINNDGVVADKIAINDSGISIDKDGINAGDKQIKNVGSGLGNTYDTTQPGQENYNNGANIGDVYAIAKSQADAEKAQSGKNITVGDDNKVNLNDNITLGSDTDASKQVNIDGNGATVTAGSGDNQVKLDGSKGQISAGGAVLGNQENTAGDKNPATGNYLTGLDNTTWDGNNIQSGRAATEDQLKTVSDKVNKGRVFQGDDGADNSVTVGLGDTLKLTGGADSNRLSDGNIGVVRNSSNDGLDIKLAKNLTNLDSVTTGNTTINNNGLTIKTVDSDRNITIEDSNINMGNNVVSGVADGTVAAGSTEAINGSQLALRDQAINSLGGTVNKLDNRINRVGAGAAALAALHPQDFDPDDKWDFAFGYGHYRGANAGAFGAFYKPNEDTTFSVGGTIGGGENMVNAGISFKVGQGNNVSNSRVGMAKEIKHLRDDVAKLEDIVNRQSQMINQLTGQNPGTIESKGNELFPDVPANHWAYEYVTKLHNLGIIEGYPDGNFDGNRMMTRYEFAAVVYRAIMAGAASNAALQGDDTLDRLANEFSAELKYIRIDTIAKDKDGKPTIQRVRIVPENKQN